MAINAAPTSARSVGVSVLSFLRSAMMARATGWRNARSGSTKTTSSLLPVWPLASVATRRMRTGSPAHGWGVRSRW